ncbi:MAG: TIGR04283 family arsenosugar biosynthesis glycosyltransferase [Calditerrivibrio sp.]|nr:TIGR04283 family arsenosugar biosynthesis glycosyltransferase [Calditerrivibrio sp.]
MRISVIIPVLKEYDRVGYFEALEKELVEHDVEIIVVDCEDGDNTISLIKSDKVIKILSPKGRGEQINKGAEVAKGEILVFLHADSFISKGHILEIINNADRYDYGAFRLKIDHNKAIFRVIETMANIRTKLFRLPYGDQTIFIKKETLAKIGGVSSIKLFEDVDLVLRCRKQGLRFYFSNCYSYTSARRWLKKGIIKTSVKNLFFLTLFLFGKNPNKLYYRYYGK